MSGSGQEVIKAVIAELQAENNRLLTQVRRVDQKYGPFEEFRYWREAAQNDGKPIERKHITDGSPCWCNPIRQRWDEEKQKWITVNTEDTTTTNTD